MRKVISIAVSTLLLGNVALAETTNTDNNLLQSIQQKIDAKKSGLGSNVQTNSGLSGLSNKSANKDINEIAKNVNSNTASSNVSANSTTPVTITPKSEINKIVAKPVEISAGPIENKSEVKPVIVNTSINASNPENCEPTKPKIIHKKIVKKHVVKKTVPVKKVEPNNFDMVKTQNYNPIDFSEKNKWIQNSQVKSSIKENGSHLEVNISDMNGHVIPKEQFNRDFIRVVQISQNFKTINRQEDNMDFLNSSYIFNKEVRNCAAIFVQYHLKSSSVPTNLVKYVSKDGSLSDSIDSSCKQNTPNDLPTNLNYSDSNNISALLFKNNKLVSSKPVSFNVVFSKDGVVRIPNDLFVYAVKSDLSDLSVLEPKNYGNNSSGISFEQNLEKGHYVLGYSFKEGKTENYFKNINVE